MADNHSDYSNTCMYWTIREGPVQVITKNHVSSYSHATLWAYHAHAKS